MKMEDFLVKPNGDSEPVKSDLMSFKDEEKGDSKETLQCVQQCSSCFQKLSIPIQDLLLWKCPLKTGLVFFISMTLLTSLQFLSLISVVAYAGLSVTMCCLALRLYHELMCAIRHSEDKNPLEQYLDKKDLFDVDWASEKLNKQFNCFVGRLGRLRDILMLKSYLETFKFSVAMYLLTILGSWFNLLTLVQLIVLYVFSAPKIYQMYQKQIDEVFCKIRHTAYELLDAAKEKLSTLPVIGPKLKTQ